MIFKTIKYKNKEFRIYKWENKPFKDFPMPEGFNWAKYFDFVELINKEKIKLEEYSVYYTENQFKANIKNNFNLSKVCICNELFYSIIDYLADSDDDGRVCIQKEVEK